MVHQLVQVQVPKQQSSSRPPGPPPSCLTFGTMFFYEIFYTRWNGTPVFPTFLHIFTKAWVASSWFCFWQDFVMCVWVWVFCVCFFVVLSSFVTSWMSCTYALGVNLVGRHLLGRFTIVPGFLHLWIILILWFSGALEMAL